MATHLTPQERDRQTALAAERRSAQGDVAEEARAPLVGLWVLIAAIVLLTFAVGFMGGRLYERALSRTPTSVVEPIVIPPDLPVWPGGGQKEARLGVYYRMLKPGDPFEVSEGALIIALLDENTPAEKAGLAPGDIITQVGDQWLSASWTLSDALSRYAAGDAVRLRTFRDGRTFTVRAVLGGP